MDSRVIIMYVLQHPARRTIANFTLISSSLIVFFLLTAAFVDRVVVLVCLISRCECSEWVRHVKPSVPPAVVTWVMHAKLFWYDWFCNRGAIVWAKIRRIPDCTKEGSIFIVVLRLICLLVFWSVLCRFFLPYGYEKAITDWTRLGRVRKNTTSIFKSACIIGMRTNIFVQPMLIVIYNSWKWTTQAFKL